MKDIQSIIKKVANRYSVEYNENGTEPMIKKADGTVRTLKVSDVEKALQISRANKEIEWHILTSISMNQLKKGHANVNISEKKYEYKSEELKVLSY